MRRTRGLAAAVALVLAGCGAATDAGTAPSSTPAPPLDGEDATSSVPRPTSTTRAGAGSPGDEQIGVGEQITISVLDEDGIVVAGGG